MKWVVVVCIVVVIAAAYSGVRMQQVIDKMDRLIEQIHEATPL